MCEPTLIVGAALTGASAISANSAAKKTSRAQQAALNRQTAMSRAEFDRRYGVVGESDKRLDELARQGFTETEAIEMLAFDEDLQSASDGFDEVRAVDRDALGRSEARQDTAFNSEIRDIMRARDGEVSSAAERLRNATNAEADTQEQYQHRANLLGATVAQRAGATNFSGNQSAAEAARAATGVSTVQAAKGPGFAALESAPDIVRRAITARGEDAVARQSEGAVADAGVGSFEDALLAARQSIARGSEDIGVLSSQADNSAAANAIEVDAGRLQSRDIETRAQGSRDNVLADVGSFLDRLAAERELTRTDLINERSAKNGVRNSFYDRTGDSARRYFTSSMGAESGFAGAITGNSSAFENTNQALTQYKINNTRTSDIFGDIAGQVGGTLLRSGATKAADKYFTG